MANKLVQQQLQNILRSLNDHDLDKILANYEVVSNATIDKSCKMVSYKCYEAAMSYKSWSTNGYGRSEAEASNNCIKNFFEMVIEDENGLTALIKALKRGNDVPAATPQPQAKEPEKAHNINNTLALNGSYGSSYAPAHDNNTSFDNRKDIEILSKNIGNISVIGNSKGPGDTVNMSQVEMDDLLLKMILEEGSHPTNTVNSNTNMRRSLPPQHPNIDLANKYHSNLHKAERLSIGGSHSNAEVEKNQNKEKKVLKENTYLYNSGGNDTHSHEKEENRHENNKHENNKHENKYENRHESKHGHATPPKSHKPKQSSVSKNVESKENKHHYHRQHSYDGYKGSAHKESSKDVSEYNSATKCTCNCAEQLQKAKSKIESLEKKLKLLTEENKILKHWAMELKEKGLKSEFSTMASICQTKSIQEKLNENYKLTPHLHYNDHTSNMYEFPDKEYSSVQTDKSRSLSLDINAKNKVTQDSHQKLKNPPGYNKENNDSMERRDLRDVRKSIPKLNLGMLPHNQTKPNLSNYASPPQHPNIAVNKGHSHHHHHAVHNSSGNHNYYEYGSGGTGSSKHLKK